eukprot:1916960-Rhodomonas_salina.1
MVCSSIAAYAFWSASPPSICPRAAHVSACKTHVSGCEMHVSMRREMAGLSQRVGGGSGREVGR